MKVMVCHLSKGSARWIVNEGRDEDSHQTRNL